MVKKITIDSSAYMDCDMIVVDRYNSLLVYCSTVASDSLLRNVAKSLKKKCNVYVQNYVHCTTSGEYDTMKEKAPNSDFSHMVIKKKDVIEKVNNTETYTFYIMYRNEEELRDVLYDKIYANAPVPIQKEWMAPIIEVFRRERMLSELTHYFMGEERPFTVCRVKISKEYLLTVVQNLLASKTISIDGLEESSDTMKECSGLDAYLNMFGDILANKIQEAFVPKFIPGVNEYTEYVNNYDDACHYGGIEIYEAQKAVIQSTVNNMNKNNSTFIIGEMGIGSLQIA